MNILYFVNRFPKLSESFVINEVHELEKRGHTVAVFSLREPELDMTHDEVSDIDAEVGYLPDPSIQSLLSTPGPWCLSTNVIKSMAHASGPKVHAGAAFIAGHCISFVESLEFDIDHIHGHFLNWPKLAAQYTAKHISVPCTVTAHAYGLYSDPDKRMLRRVSDRLDHILTISEYNRRYLNEQVGTTSPVDVAHVGINPDKFQPTQSYVDNRILTVGRFVEKKGIRYAIEAVADIVEDVPNLEYHIVGSGPLEDDIRETIRKHNLQDAITILGNISDEELIEEYNEAEVFLLPCVIAEDGDRDGIPVVLMEAMAMECVPISTHVSGIPELIEDGKNGFLCNPRDIKGISEKIQYTICTLEDRELAVKARNRVRSEFNSAKQAAETLAVFEQTRDR